MLTLLIKFDILNIRIIISALRAGKGPPAYVRGGTLCQ